MSATGDMFLDTAGRVHLRRNNEEYPPPPDLGKATQIAASMSWFAALQADGQLRFWGPGASDFASEDWSGIERIHTVKGNCVVGQRGDGYVVENHGSGWQEISAIMELIESGFDHIAASRVNAVVMAGRNSERQWKLAGSDLTAAPVDVDAAHCEEMAEGCIDLAVAPPLVFGIKSR